MSARLIALLLFEATRPSLASGGTVSVIGSCALTHGGNCVTSPNYPQNYDPSDECTISGLPAVPLEVLFFETEGYSSFSCTNSDYLQVCVGPRVQRGLLSSRGARGRYHTWQTPGAISYVCRG